MISRNKMYQALLKKDSNYEGLFFVAVKTTGIFCRPTCNARKPKKENVEFYKTPKDAILNGFRPCKVCRPLEQAGTVPEYIRKLLLDVENSPFKKITNYDLVKQNIEPNKVRRWFKTNHGITFSGFQRMMRLNIAFQQIKNGDSVSGTAFDSGFNSLSGFSGAFKNIIGINPSNAVLKNIITMKRIATPLGPMLAGATEKGICLFEFSDRRMLEFELKELKRLLKANIIYSNNPHIAILEKQISEYFDGKRKIFDIPLDTPGTEFQKLAWKKLIDIPFGKTISYKQQAVAIGKPSAVRAVGKANGFNRISIIIPCHRVIAENGNLTGYGGGLWRKKWLLEFEKNVVLGNSKLNSN